MTACWARERQVDKCERRAISFRCGKWCCPDHTPNGAANCSHSLSGDGQFCAYCGGEVAP